MLNKFLHEYNMGERHFEEKEISPEDGYHISADLFWMHEIIVEPCHGCKKRKRCFDIFRRKISRETKEKAMDRMRSCSKRNEELWT